MNCLDRNITLLHRIVRDACYQKSPQELHKTFRNVCFEFQTNQANKGFSPKNVTQTESLSGFL
ncbi:hypothetical protein SOPP22_15260 [Shewanella sp. OPT22]|nr:hypothetical protein SOPP22_15260 [Shewanella sp. OPT22]